MAGDQGATLRKFECPKGQRYLMFNAKGNNTMVRFIPQSEVMKYFNYRMAIIQMRVGEHNEEAWQRHLIETPNDIYATTSVFNS
jgi:hypothetical protein